MFITGAVIATVGLRQLADAHEELDKLVNRTSKALRLANLTRINLLMSIRAEKNSVLEFDKAKAKDWAERANKSKQESEQNKKELSTYVDTSLGTREGKAFDEFDRGTEL